MCISFPYASLGCLQSHNIDHSPVGTCMVARSHTSFLSFHLISRRFELSVFENGEILPAGEDRTRRKSGLLIQIQAFFCCNSIPAFLLWRAAIILLCFLFLLFTFFPKTFYSLDIFHGSFEMGKVIFPLS